MQAFVVSARTAATLFGCIAAMTLAAAMDWRIVSMAAAAIAAMLFVYTAITENRRLERTGPTTTNTVTPAAIAAGRINAQLIGAVYNWGGLAMLTVYALSGIYWRHGWQYGLGMLLIALGLYNFARKISAPSSPLATPAALAISAMLALAQGIAAALALVILVASGKLATAKGDWAANHIFVAGGLAIVVISVLAYATHRRLSR
ncbi:MAG: hypothetical protein AB7I44_17475 [Hyphomicrobiaceae bacterium]